MWLLSCFKNCDPLSSFVEYPWDSPVPPRKMFGLLMCHVSACTFHLESDLCVSLRICTRSVCLLKNMVYIRNVVAGSVVITYSALDACAISLEILISTKRCFFSIKVCRCLSWEHLTIQIIYKFIVFMSNYDISTVFPLSSLDRVTNFWHEPPARPHAHECFPTHQMHCCHWNGILGIWLKERPGTEMPLNLNVL